MTGNRKTHKYPGIMRRKNHTKKRRKNKAGAPNPKLTTKIGELYKELGNTLYKDDIKFYRYITALTARQYSYHYDTLLNGLIRKRNIDVLLLKYFKEGDEWYGSDSAYDEYKKPCDKLKYPVVNRGSTEKDQWINYLDDMYGQLNQLYHNLLTYRIQFDTEVTVYRGLYIEPTNEYPYTYFTGFTSTAYDIDSALQIMMMDYENPTPQPKHKEYFVLLEIRVPANTPIYSTNLCTIQVENEIIFTENAQLVDTTESEYTFNAWIPFIEEGIITDANYKDTMPVTIKHITGRYKKSNDLSPPHFSNAKQNSYNAVKSMRDSTQAEKTKTKTKFKKWSKSITPWYEKLY